jgi:23S rRNA (pseudouridine1915-N3)-methyltransferase
MKPFTLITIGKVKESFCKDGIAEFTKRLSKELDIITLKESTKQKEALDIKKTLENNNYDISIALDEHGEEYTSIEFAKLIKKNQDKKIVFILGNATGLDATVLKSAKKTIALSKMTFTHEMAQLFFIEQLYRAQSINQGKEYHKE